MEWDENTGDPHNYKALFKYKKKGKGSTLSESLCDMPKTIAQTRTLKHQL